MKNYSFSLLLAGIRQAGFAILFDAAFLVSLPAWGANGTDTWSTTTTSGTWNAAGQWTGTNKPPISGDSLAFGSTTGTTTLVNNLTGTFANINGITFNAGASAYTITGTVINLASASSITNNSSNLETINDNLALLGNETVTIASGGGNVTLGGTISGAFGLTATNGNQTTVSPVTLTLNGANTFSGGLTVNPNTFVSLGSNTAAGTGAINLIGDAGGTHPNLANGLTNVSGSALTLANTLNLGYTALSKDYITQVIAGSSALTFSGTVNNESGTGATNRQGFLSITNSAGVTFGNLNLALSTGTATGYALNITGAGNLTINGTVADGTASATGQSLTWDNTGTLTLNGAINNTGALGIVAGTVAISSTASTAGTTSLFFGNGAPYASTSGYNSNVTLGAATSSTLTITGTVGGKTDNFSNYYSSVSGGTNFSQGAGHLNLTPGAGGSLVVNLGNIVRYGSIANGASTLDIQTGTGVTVNSLTTNPVGAILPGITVNGNTWATSAVAAVTGISSSATGNLLSGVALTAGQQVLFTTIPTGSGLTAGKIYYVLSPSGSTFQVAATPGGTALTLGTSTANGTATPAAALTGLTTYNTTYSSSGNNNLDVQSTGTLTYNPNTIRFNTAGSYTVTLPGAAATPLAGEGILETSTVAGNTSTITGGILLGGGTSNNSGLQRRDLLLIQNNPSGNLVINSIIASNGVNTPSATTALQNAGDLVKSGAGTVVLNGNNSYYGQTYVNEGTLIATGGYTSATTQTSLSTTSGSATITVGAGTTSGLFVGENVTGSSWTGYTVPVVITAINSGANQITVSGAPNVTNVGGATLNFMGSGALGNGGSYGGNFISSVAGVAAGATLQIGNSTATGALAPNQSIIDSGTFVFGGNGALNLGANNVISGTGIVNQTGAGSTTLAGANTYIGGTSVTGGTLIAYNSGGSSTASSTGLGAVTVSGTAASYGTLAGGTDSTNSGSYYTPPVATSQVYSPNGANVTGAISINQYGHLAPGNGAAGAGSIGSLDIGTLNLAAGSSIDYNFDAANNANSWIYTTGPVTVTGSTTLNLYKVGTTTAFNAPGTYSLLQYSTLSGANYLSVGNQQADFSYNLSNDTADTQILLGITENVAYWTGASSNSWATNSNWNTSASGTIVGYSPGSTTDVVFSTSSPTATNLTTTLGAVTAVNSLNFNSSTSGHTIVVNGSSPLTINAATTTGSGGINSGSNGINLATGSGTVTINAPLNLGAAQNWTVADAGNILTVGGVISGTGTTTLTKLGAGTLLLSGTNTYTATTAVNAGTLSLGGNGVIAGAVTVGGTSASNSPTLNGTGRVSGAVTVASAGGGAAGTISPGSGYTGILTVGSITFQTGSVFALNLDGTTNTELVSTGAATIQTGALISFTLGGTSLSQSTYILASAASGFSGGLSGTFTVSGLTPTNYALTYTGTAVELVALSTPANVAYFNGAGADLNTAANYDSSVSGGTANTSTPTGTTNVFFSSNGNTATSASTSAPLAVNSLNFGVGTGTNSGITVSGTSAITITGSAVNGNAAGSGITTTGTGSDTISAPIALAASQTWSVDTGGKLTVSGTVSGSSTTLTKAGAGTLVLSGANTYTGGTTVTTGTLQLAGSSVTTSGAITSGPVGTGLLTLADGTTLLDSGSIINLANAISLGGTINLAGTGGFNFDKGNLTTGNTVTLTSATTLNVTDSSTITDNIVGGYSLTKIGSGTLLLTGSNSSSAPTTVSSGTVQLSNTGALGTGSISLAGGTALQYTGTSSGTLSKTITVSSGAGTVSNTGGQVLTLSGTLNKNGTTLNINGGKNVITGVITGSLANSDLNYIGGTTTGVTAAGTYNGPTSISGGSTVLAGVNDALADTNGGASANTVLTLGASGETSSTVNTLDLLGHNQTVGGLYTSGNGTNQIISSNGSATTPAIGSGASSTTGTLTVNLASGTDTYGGSIGGTGGLNNLSLTKSGSGTLVLTNGNTYIGGTTINAGTLVVNNSTGSATGTGALNLTSGATLSGTGTISATNATVAGNVNVGNGGTTDILHLTASGTTNFSNASLTFNLDTVTLGNSSQVALGNTASVLFSNTALTLNLVGSNFITTPTDYLLFSSTQTYDVFSGLTVGSGGLITGGLNLSVTGPNAGLYSGSYLLLVGNGLGGDNIVAVVPEPGTWALMLGGLVLLLAFQRVRHKKNA